MPASANPDDLQRCFDAHAHLLAIAYSIVGFQMEGEHIEVFAHKLSSRENLYIISVASLPGEINESVRSKLSDHFLQQGETPELGLITEQGADSYCEARASMGSGFSSAAKVFL